MQTHFPADEKLIKFLQPGIVQRFSDWMDKLEGLMDKFEAKHGQRPYSKPLAENTGLGCWYESFQDGMTPEEAFAADRDCWD